jgi:glycerol-3-phosphate dehydrogenase
VGTTDTPVAEATLEPRPLAQEIEFILSTAALYLHKKPKRSDILSAFVGIRPLVKSGHGRNTAALSRDHTIHIDQSGLISIAGGKWTTYRNMAEDCVNQAATLARLTERPSVTKHLNIHGYHQHAERFGSLAVYGSDAPFIQDLIRKDALLGKPLHPALPYNGAEVLWAVREEMARTVEDVLARRTRALFLNAQAAVLMAPCVAALMARELGRDAIWEAEEARKFNEVARRYLVT